MNTQKNFFIAGIAILGIIALSLVFMAGRMSGGFSDHNGRSDCPFSEGRGMMGEGREGREGKFGGMSNKGMMGEMRFLSGLSGEQKTQVAAIKEKFKTQMQELMQSSKTSTGASQDELTQKINDLWKTHMAELRPFVAQDQLTDFDAFVAEGKPQMPMMLNGGRNMRNTW